MQYWFVQLDNLYFIIMTHWYFFVFLLRYRIYLHTTYEYIIGHFISWKKSINTSVKLLLYFLIKIYSLVIAVSVLHTYWLYFVYIFYHTDPGKIKITMTSETTSYDVYLPVHSGKQYNSTRARAPVILQVCSCRASIYSGIDWLLVNGGRSLMSTTIYIVSAVTLVRSVNSDIIHLIHAPNVRKQNEII